MLLVILILLGLGFGPVLAKEFKNLGLVIGSAISSFIFTTLLIFLAFIFGVNYGSLIMALILTGLFSLFCFLKFKPEIKITSLPLVLILVLLTSGFWVSYIWLTQTLAISDVGLKTGGGGMYGDSALHSAYTSRMEMGEFPPQNPLYAGKILVYPLANDLLSATLRMTGLNYNLAFALPQIIFWVAFVTIFYKICRKFTGNLGYLIAFWILMLGWGVGFYFFLRDWGSSSIWQFLNREYTNNPDYNLHFHNILTGLILPERSFLPGLVLGLLMFFYFIKYFENKKLIYLIISGLILGSLPYWHTHSFIFLAITSLIFGLWQMREKPKIIARHLLVMSALALLVATPFLLMFLLNHEPGKFLHFAGGWQNGSENLLIFWLKNSFLTIPLAILGLILVKKELRIFFIPAFVVFILANLVIFQPWNWDNIKILSWSFLFFAILAGVYLEKLFVGGWLKLVVIFLVVISSLSGLLSLTFQLKNSYVIYNREDLDLVAWAKKNTSIDDVFLIEPIPNHPIPGLSGRLVYVGYPGHLWVHGIDYAKRENLNKNLMSGNFSLINETEVPISYIVFPRSNLVTHDFNVVYENNKYVVIENIRL